MSVTLALCALLSAPLDTSPAYFTGLARPRASRVEVSREGGPVILIVVDAMRPDRMSPYGFARRTTPQLDRLADEGLILTNYFVNANWTRPSTASLITGLFPAVHAVEGERDRLTEEFVTLAEQLGRVGVPTGAVVGNGNAGSAFGLSRGFSFYADTVRHWQGLPSAEQVVELAVPFVSKHAAEPFFLMLFFVDPHDPYRAPEPYENMFVTDLRVPLIRSPHWERSRYTREEVERMQATYDGALRYTDSVIGQFFDHLKRLGVYERATIVVTADHGEAFGEHGVYLHSHHLFDEIIRAPLIIRAPKMSIRGVYNPYLFQTVDLMPTLLSAFGAPAPAGLPGVDILAHLNDPRRNLPERVVVSEFHNFGIKRRTARTYERKVIYAEPADEKEFMATVGKRELLPSVSFSEEQVHMYHLARDPFEAHNLYDASRGVPGPKFERLWKLLKEMRRTPRQDVVHVVENLDPETRDDLRALGYIQ